MKRAKTLHEQEFQRNSRFHVCIRVGNWMFQNGHLYRYQLQHNPRGNVSFWLWATVI